MARTKNADSPLRHVRGAVEAPAASGALLAGDPNDRGGSMRPPRGLAADWPVQPLGYKGDVYFFLGADRHFKAIRDEKFTQNKMLSLYAGNDDILEATWPRIGAKGTVTGLDTVRCYSDHMTACHAAGPWDPANRMRETGGWREPDGTLVLHCGNVLVAKTAAGAESERKPGKHGDYVYSKGEAQPQPWPDPVQGKQINALVDGFGSFAWARAELDAHLLLGWCVAAIMGGALKWRPLLWITGDKGTGKSTLQEMLEHLMGGALVHASDASAAGIYQALKFSSRPVTLDEMEAQEDNRKAQMVIQLARQASSGGLVLRGGQDHAGVEFIARSCFLFSSINHPPLLPQDLSRMAILDLGTWRGVQHGLDEEKLHALGRKLRRRIVDAWPKWEERLEHWRQGLKRVGHSDRVADQFGTLLAGADLALNDRMPHADNVDADIERFGLLRLAEQADDTPDWQKMGDRMMTAPTDVQRQGRKINAAYLLQLYFDRIQFPATADLSAIKAEAERDLMMFGLKPVLFEDRWYVAIANNHQGLAKLFEGSHWAGRSGAVGVWVQAARRVPGARWDNQIQRFNGVPIRCTLIPVEHMLPPEPAPIADAARAA